MFDKLFNFLGCVAMNGFISVFIAVFVYIIVGFVFVFAMIPVAIIAGDDIATKVLSIVGGDFGYKIIYIIVFTSLMMDDMGIPNLKTSFNSWWAKRKASTTTA